MHETGEVEGESGLGIDVKFADDAGAIAAGLEASDQIGRAGAVVFELVRGEAEVAVLLRVKPGQAARARRRYRCEN
jgi:hypothetical protein